MSKKADQARRKHIPVRTCIVCREALAKRSLNRIVQVPGTGLVVDPSGKMPGRGAYLCSKLACWEKAAARDNSCFSHALRTVISEDEKEALLAEWLEKLKPEDEPPDAVAG
mgnify:CR=1 FL=1